MLRTVSCYSNSYGPAGVRSAVEGIAGAGLSRVELALRGHDFGGLVIPESAVVTHSTDPEDIKRFLEHMGALGIAVSGCNVGGADLRTPEGFELTARRLRFAGSTFGAPLAVSGAGQPGDDTER